MSLHDDDADAETIGILSFKPQLEDMSHMVRRKITHMRETGEEKPEEPKISDLVSMTKLLQTLCDLADDARRAEQESDDSGTDIVEFRQKLERQIEALGASPPDDSTH